MLSQKLLMLLMIGILLPLGGSILFLEYADAQRFVPIGEADIYVSVRNVGNPLIFSVDYKVTDESTSTIILSGSFNMVPSNAGNDGFGSSGAGTINTITNPGPYTVEITPVDPLNTWIVIGGFCFFDVFQNITTELSVSGQVIDLTSSGQRGSCEWNLDNDGIPPIDDTIQDNLKEIVEALEGKDQKIQDLLDKQVGHDDAIKDLENFKVTIDGDKIKFKELELTVDQMISSLQLILQELLLL